ncbi:MAG: beta-galactosidase [Eubacterium sp.]|nr:beta-galactosidase [Eubacterium sp.]
MVIGVDYYPEQWDKSMWLDDVKLMAKTGVKVVRLAEFCWQRLEPAEGIYDFAWLDEIVGLFEEYDIDVVMCTPTNNPPRWMFQKYPEVIPVERDGKRMAVGIRGHRCYNSPKFRFFAEKIIEKMADHYKDRKIICAWQIDNELDARICYCDKCNEKHRQWLKARYKSLENLNNTYGMVVWSGEYSDWSQIDPPYGDSPENWLNPSYMLDYKRRASEDVAEFCDFQAEIIRKYMPGTKITTNTWFCENMPDIYEQFRSLDFVAYDNYPTTDIPDDLEDIYSHAFHLDFMRGGLRKKFWIMEELSGGIGSWAPMAKTTRPGMLEGYSLQSFMHGADTVVHFRWRTATKGAEMYWHGLLDHSNIPGRRFREFEDLCRRARELEKYSDTDIHSDVAILYSAENEWALNMQPQTNGMYYYEQLKLLHAAFKRYGINVDIISQKADLQDYKVVCIPLSYVTDEETVNNLHEFARNGGRVILGVRSGVKDSSNNCIMDLLPTLYRDMVGCHVAEYDSIGNDTVEIKFSDGEIFTCRQWCDVLELDGGDALAYYEGGFYKGKPAITVNTYGKGKAYYIGSVGKRTMYEKIAKEILDDLKISYYDNLPENVEITRRVGDSLDIICIFNNSENIKELEISGQRISLKAFEMKVMEI